MKPRSILHRLIYTSLLQMLIGIRIWAQPSPPLDSLHRIDSLTEYNLIGSLRWSGWYLHSPGAQDSLISGLKIRSAIPPHRLYRPEQRTRNEAVRILAWYKVDRRWKAWQALDPERVHSDTSYTILCWVKLDDSSRRTSWLLTVGTLSINEQGKHSTSFSDFEQVLDRTWSKRMAAGVRRLNKAMKRLKKDPHVKMPRNSVVSKLSLEEQIRIASTPGPGIKLFDHPPTSDEIYRFLDTLSIRTNGPTRSARDFFDPEAVANAEEGEEYLDGDVREKAWREVTGEEPKMFFPGEK